MDIPQPPPEQGEVVLFEGPNGSGKTTIIETLISSLARVQRVRFSPGSDFLEPRLGGGAELLVRWQGEQGEIFEIQHSPGVQLRAQGDAPLEISNFLRSVRENFAPIAVHQAIFSYSGHHPTPSISSRAPDGGFGPSQQAGALDFGRGETFSSRLGQLLTNLEYERTKAIAYALETPGRSDELRARAASLAGARSRIESALSRMLGREVRFVFDIQHQAPRILFDGEEMRIEWLGEGLRRTFSWLADLLARLESIQWEDTTRSPHDQDFLLFLDEVDQSLHPTMQMRLVPTLRQLFPGARIYATTHSPFVVASVEQGVVFSLRPDPRSHRVIGATQPRPLHGGQTLEAIVSEVFDAPATFIDETTRTNLARHKRMIDDLRRGQEIDRGAFLDCRGLLWGLGDEVRTVLAMREVPVRGKLEHLLQGALREAGE